MNSISHQFFRILWLKYVYSTILIIVILYSTWDGNGMRILLLAWVLLRIGYQAVRYTIWYSQAKREENPPLPAWIHLDIELTLGLLVFLLFTILGLCVLFLDKFRDSVSRPEEIVVCVMTWMWLLMMVYYWKVEFQYRALRATSA